MLDMRPSNAFAVRGLVTNALTPASRACVTYDMPEYPEIMISGR